ncbi:MAG: hypothetical protein DSO01_07645 [Archaeoglobi archaeon]|nr:MAG: hypothetical protein DSO01_07645 [Archaeoglobi archaeon]
MEDIGKIVPNGFVWSAYHPQGTCRMSGDPFRGVVDSYGRAHDFDNLYIADASTCRMSGDPFRGVVDSYGKAHDFDNLYIADASIFPTSVKVNPMLSIMGFAMRTAERIAEV